MKAIKIFGILILAGIIIVFAFFYFAFSGTTWGGWTPPDTSLELNSQEVNWVNSFEKKYDCNFNFIGLDGSFMEDSIIYMRLYCKNQSKLSQKITTEGEMFTQEFCKSFLSSSNYKRPRKYIEITYENIKIEDKRYPVRFKYLYYNKSDSIVKI